MRHRALRAGIGAAALVAAGGFAFTVGQPAAKAEPECLTSSNDFNADGRTDVVVGSPGHPDYPGSVDVRLTYQDGLERHLVAEPNGQAGDRFGAAVAEVADYQAEDEDTRCSLLVVGAPNRDVNGLRDAGAIFLFQYDRSTEQLTFVHEYHQGADGVPGAPQAGAHFGAVLAAPYHHDDIGPVVTPLYVGIPGANVAGQVGAGAFARLTFSDAATPRVEDGILATQDTPGVPGTAEAGDEFGSALACGNNSVFVGIPGEDIGSASNAGSILYWQDDRNQADTGVNQDTRGVPGHVEAGDRFGQSLYAAHETGDGLGYDLLVGAPHENVGDVVDAGAVWVLPVNESAFHLDGSRSYSQATSGVAGTPERYDYFGESLGTSGPHTYVAGAPGEDVGGVADAGMVETLTGDRSWNEGTTGVPGRLESRDRFGATLGNALVPMDPDQNSWLDLLLVGVPGKSDSAGAVVKGLSGSTAALWTPAAPRAGDQYGAAIGKTN